MTRALHRSTLVATLLAVSLVGTARPALAEEVVVAVASNFAAVAEGLARRFEGDSGHQTTVVAGSTGKLYAQIVRGAPFDVFLAADVARPVRLVEEEHAVAGSRHVYAIGRLVLWSGEGGRRGDLGPQTLRAGGFRRLAMANPDLAPYGAASREVLDALGVREQVAPRLVFGENIGQAFALVASGNAELGFVAQSQLVARGAADGTGWLVPRALHAPIRQERVLLARAADNAGARAFLDYLSTPAAREVIRAAGYEVE